MAWVSVRAASISDLLAGLDFCQGYIGFCSFFGWPRFVRLSSPVLCLADRPGFQSGLQQFLVSVWLAGLDFNQG
jgi:hypothetical protein